MVWYINLLSEMFVESFEIRLAVAIKLQVDYTVYNKKCKLDKKTIKDNCVLGLSNNRFEIYGKS